MYSVEYSDDEMGQSMNYSCCLGGGNHVKRSDQCAMVMLQFSDIPYQKKRPTALE